MPPTNDKKITVKNEQKVTIQELGLYLWNAELLIKFQHSIFSPLEILQNELHSKILETASKAALEDPTQQNAINIAITNLQNAQEQVEATQNAQFVAKKQSMQDKNPPETKRSNMVDQSDQVSKKEITTVQFLLADALYRLAQANEQLLLAGVKTQPLLPRINILETTQQGLSTCTNPDTLVTKIAEAKSQVAEAKLQVAEAELQAAEAALLSTITPSEEISRLLALRNPLKSPQCPDSDLATARAILNSQTETTNDGNALDDLFFSPFFFGMAWLNLAKSLIDKQADISKTSSALQNALKFLNLAETAATPRERPDLARNQLTCLGIMIQIYDKNSGCERQKEDALTQLKQLGQTYPSVLGTENWLVLANNSTGKERLNNILRALGAWVQSFFTGMVGNKPVIPDHKNICFPTQYGFQHDQYSYHKMHSSSARAMTAFGASSLIITEKPSDPNTTANPLEVVSEGNTPSSSTHNSPPATEPTNPDLPLTAQFHPHQSRAMV